MRNVSKLGGITIILFALFYLASFVFASPIVGLEDGDNPATTLAFIKEHPDLYFLSGVTAAIAAIMLTVSVFAIGDVVFQLSSSVLGRTTAAFGLFTSAFLFVHGILRMNSPGTLLYMATLNPDWGKSAYLAVQMAGTQGLAGAAIFGLSIWVIGLSLGGWFNRKFPLILAVFGLVPTLPWLMGLLGRAGILPDSLWLLYIGAIILGIPLWGIIVGLFLLFQKPSS